MAVTVDQILKLYVSGMLSGTGTQGDPIILDDLPPNTVIGDLGAGTGPITVAELKTAMGALDSVLVDGVTITGDGVSTPLVAVGGGSGNAGVRPLNVIVATGDDTIDLEQWAFDYWQIDLSAVSSETISITDPLTSAVPLIHLHFLNMVGDVTVSFPSSMRDANGDALGSHVFSQGQIVPFYFAGGFYYTNYLDMNAGGGGNLIIQDDQGVPISSTTSNVTTLFSFEGTGNILVQQSGTKVVVSDTASFGPETEAVLSYASSEGYSVPRNSVLQAHDNLIASLKAAGSWGKMEWFYIMAHDDIVPDFCGINWRDPASFELVYTDRGNAVPVNFTADAANVGDPDNSDYLLNPFLLSSDAQFLTDQEISIGYAVVNANNGGTHPFIIRNDGELLLGYSIATGGIQRPSCFQLGSASDDTAFDTSLYGARLASVATMNASRVMKSWVDNNFIGSKTVGPLDIDNTFGTNQFVIPGRSDGAVLSGGGGECSACFIGGLLTDAEALATSTALKEWADAIEALIP